MQKTFCEVCGLEVVHDGKYFQGQSGRLVFSLTAGIDKIDEGDPCFTCVIKAINKEAEKALRRKYTKRAEKPPKSTPEVSSKWIARNIDLSDVVLKDGLNDEDPIVIFGGKEWRAKTIKYAIILMLQDLKLIKPEDYATGVDYEPRVREIIEAHCSDENTKKILLASFQEG